MKFCIHPSKWRISRTYFYSLSEFFQGLGKKRWAKFFGSAEKCSCAVAGIVRHTLENWSLTTSGFIGCRPWAQSATPWVSVVLPHFFVEKVAWNFFNKLSLLLFQYHNKYGHIWSGFVLTNTLRENCVTCDAISQISWLRCH